MVFVIYVLCFLWSKNSILNCVIYRENLLNFQWTVMELNVCTVPIFVILSCISLYVAIVAVSNFKLDVSTNRCGRSLCDSRCYSICHCRKSHTACIYE